MPLKGIAQAGDIVVIRKNGQGIKTFMKGLYTTFKTSTGYWVNAYISDIKNDSVYFKEVIVRQVPTQWGVSRLDTMATIITGLHYLDIVAIPKKRAPFSFIKNGTLFMAAGGGYVALNIVNSAILHYPIFSKQNTPALLTGIAVFGIGKLMHKLHKNVISVGKTYSIHYIKIK